MNFSKFKIMANDDTLKMFKEKTKHIQKPKSCQRKLKGVKALKIHVMRKIYCNRVKENCREPDSIPNTTRKSGNL